MYLNFYEMHSYFCHFMAKIFNRIPEEVRKLKKYIKRIQITLSI